MTAAVQEPQQVGQVLSQPQPQVESHPPQFHSLIYRMKEGVLWVWNATYEKIEAAGSQLKMLLQKVVEAIRTFFGPKLAAAKQAVLDLYDRFTSKKVAEPAPVVTPPVAVAPPQEPQPIEPVIHRREEAPPLAPTQQVPQPIEEPLILPLGEQPRQQQPIEPLPIAAALPAAPLAAPVAPVVPAELHPEAAALPAAPPAPAPVAPVVPAELHPEAAALPAAPPAPALAAPVVPADPHPEAAAAPQRMGLFSFLPDWFRGPK